MTDRPSYVSVVVPVGAVDRRLLRQVDAVVAQQLDCPFEVVLSLNARNLSPETLATLMPRDPRVRIVGADACRGAAYARNEGARHARGDVLAFCDADDLVHRNWLRALVDGVTGHDAVCGRVIDVFPDARTARWHPPATPGQLPTFLGHAYVLTGNLAVWRRAFDAVGGFDESLTRCEDIAFGWALTRAGFSIGYVDDAVVEYHRRAGMYAMLRTHYLYGRGMSETLVRYGTPANGDCTASASSLALLKPNGQRGAHRGVGSTARRGAIALGRTRGLVEARVRRRRDGA